MAPERDSPVELFDGKGPETGPELLYLSSIMKQADSQALDEVRCEPFSISDFLLREKFADSA